MIAYRRDIDGLRSVAVLSVVLYHFGVPAFSGGFVGVDVFFVISGLLIGRMILDDVRAGRFSYVRFYERRIRRLVPAFAVVFAATLAASCLLLLPIDLKAFGKSLAAAVLGLSNNVFYFERGYFDAQAIRKPLLHTWSLAVEEQFYVVMPVFAALVAGAGKRPRFTMGALIAVTIVSAVAAQLMLPRDPTGVFYLLPYRAWELLVGVIVGNLGARYRVTSAALAGVLGWVGLALILAPIFLYTHATPFPGITAIPPVIGTAMILHAGTYGQRHVNALLSHRAPVFIGLISYSLYLWHWPIIVMIAYYAAGQDSTVLRVVGFLMALVLATLSWRYVERPFRDPQWIGRKSVFVWAGVTAALLIGAGTFVWKSQGLPQRYDGDAMRLVEASGDFAQSTGHCDPRQDAPNTVPCGIGVEDAPPSFLVIGDSHVRAFQDGIDTAAREAGRGGLYLWLAGCPPLIGVGKLENANTPEINASCLPRNQGIPALLRAHPEVRDVILIGRWAYYTEGTGTGADTENRVTFTDAARQPVADIAAQRAMFARGFEATVRAVLAEHRRVFILEQVPEIPDSNARNAAIQVLSGQASAQEVQHRLGTVAQAVVERRQAAAQAVLARLATLPGVTILRTHDRFCGGGTCSAWAEGRPVLFDNNHITVRESQRIRSIFAPALAPLPQAGVSR